MDNIDLVVMVCDLSSWNIHTSVVRSEKNFDWSLAPMILIEYIEISTPKYHLVRQNVSKYFFVLMGSESRKRQTTQILPDENSQSWRVVVGFGAGGLFVWRESLFRTLGTQII